MQRFRSTFPRRAHRCWENPGALWRRPSSRIGWRRSQRAEARSVSVDFRTAGNSRERPCVMEKSTAQDPMLDVFGFVRRVCARNAACRSGEGLQAAKQTSFRMLGLTAGRAFRKVLRSRGHSAEHSWMREGMQVGGFEGPGGLSPPPGGVGGSGQ